MCGCAFVFVAVYLHCICMCICIYVFAFVVVSIEFVTAVVCVGIRMCNYILICIRIYRCMCSCMFIAHSGISLFANCVALTLRGVNVNK